MGHHVYYRQRYRDSIHRTAEREFQGDAAHGGPRDLRRVLCPLPLESQSHDGSDPQNHPRGKPKGLSIARRLFGYVGTSNGCYSPTEPLTFGVSLTEQRSAGSGQQPASEDDSQTGPRQPTDFAQLAGRIALNTAIEVIRDGEASDADQFLSASHACLVPLRPLGAPKPSAVEHYLTQDLRRVGRRVDGGILCTYGDTPGDPSAGDLRGRKFYLHQPDAARLPEGYNHCFELGVSDPKPEDWGKVYVQQGHGKNVRYFERRRPAEWRMDEDREMLLSNQAMIARFVSRLGAEFRTTLRFSNLEKWELGAVLFCLAPSPAALRRLAEKLGSGGRPVLQWLKNNEPKATEEAPLLAQKLGHGRPLGLGSVLYRLDGLMRIGHPQSGPAQDVANRVEVNSYDTPESLENVQGELIDALAQWLCEKAFGRDQVPLAQWVESVLLPWLEVHRHAGRTRYDHPRDVPPPQR